MGRRRVCKGRRTKDKPLRHSKRKACEGEGGPGLHGTMGCREAGREEIRAEGGTRGNRELQHHVPVKAMGTRPHFKQCRAKGHLSNRMPPTSRQPVLTFCNLHYAVPGFLRGFSLP
ncbi:hypothetical protein R1flu_015431 [Riccia fluitans]|uniref:Uncharacterized protein n=1 Tax=Riccia fluitans TaxID=41844 RepID=A0ABD1YJS2_9MARC